MDNLRLCAQCKYYDYDPCSEPCVDCIKDTKSPNWVRANRSEIASNDKLILLVGASGSGKTTISKELEKEGFNIIHSYTTRKPREENEWGHRFLDWRRRGIDDENGYVWGITNEDTLWETDDYGEERFYNEDIIAFFDSYGEYYFATREQYQNKGTSVYVIDPSGAKEVLENVKDAEVVTIFIQVDEYERYRRMIGDVTRTPLDVESRMQKDKDVFKVCKCDYVVDGNRDIPEVLKDIVEIIK